LVTFLWRDREKLPALAGRIPAAVHRVERLGAKATFTAIQIFISHLSCHCV
jgi:hypothetical protein